MYDLVDDHPLGLGHLELHGRSAESEGPTDRGERSWGTNRGKGIPVSADFSAGVSKGKFTTFEIVYIYNVGLLFLLT